MDQFSKDQLLNILQDIKNMDQNSFFISVFPIKTIDELWMAWAMNEAEKNELSDLACLFLIAFSVEGSIPSFIRKGDLFWQNRFLPEPNTLLLDAELNIPKGVVSQLITVLNIEHLVFNSHAALESTFDLDFPLVSNQIKSCSFYNVSSDYQLKALYSSKSIEKLAFTNVKGEILPKDLSLAISLKTLEFRLCSLNTLPILNKNKSKLESVVINESLTAKSVNLDFLPKSLQDLDLSMNKLNNIIGLLNLERLENLNISSCFFKSFEFSQVPQNLKRLNLRDNELTIFPKAPNNLMSDLEYLDVSHNHISEIPTEIVNLKSLNEFLCSHNKLESLPEADSFWAGIIRLDIRNNHLRNLPNSMINLTKMTYLDVEDNFLTEFTHFYKYSGLDRATIRLRGNPFSNEEKHKLLSLETSYLDL
jgi:hypothetical protein